MTAFLPLAKTIQIGRKNKAECFFLSNSGGALGKDCSLSAPHFHHAIEADNVKSLARELLSPRSASFGRRSECEFAHQGDRC